MSRLWRAGVAVAGLALFTVALALLTSASRDLAPLVSQWRISRLHHAIGLGWVGAYVVLSGSPVAVY